MRKFFLKIVPLLAPFLLVLGFPLLVLISSHELLPVRWIVLAQRSNSRALFGLAYSNADVYYKLQRVLQRRPRILALGTSRVMQFRAHMFKDPKAFYNAGGGVRDLPEFSVFMGRLPPVHQPKILIIGLDQYFFNDNWDRARDRGEYERALSGDSREGLEVIAHNWKKVYQDYFGGKFRMASLLLGALRMEKIGLYAHAKDRGFRTDGSYSYGIASEAERQHRFDDTFQRIENSRSRFEKGHVVSSDAMEELRAYLNECRKRGIHVIGFLPPYAHSVYARMAVQERDYEYLFKIANSIKPIFERHQYTLSDFSDIASLGLTDEEALDGFHGSEEAYSKILLHLARQDAILNKAVDD